MEVDVGAFGSKLLPGPTVQVDLAVMHVHPSRATLTSSLVPSAVEYSYLRWTDKFILEIPPTCMVDNNQATLDHDHDCDSA